MSWLNLTNAHIHALRTQADDDDVINPLQLRLVMSRLPRHGRVLWGRSLPYKHRSSIKPGCPTGKKAGVLYVRT